MQPKSLLILIGVILVIAFLLFGYSLYLQSGFQISFPKIESDKGINVIAIFLTGLITGGLTCMAVQGGLLAATIAQREEQSLKKKVSEGHALPIIIFLGSKIISYSVLGMLLGSLGSFFTLSLSLQVLLQLVVAIFMIGTVLNIFEVHPIFRYFVIQPPRFLTRIIRRQSKSQEFFAPALVGALTVFIPCGTTQAMMALSIASGSPLLGGVILFAFTVGTSPIFFILGYFATKLGERLHKNFMRVAALSILILAFFNIYNALALSGIVLPPRKSQTVSQVGPLSDVTIMITDRGYVPSDMVVKAGTSVKLHLVNNDAYACASAFSIPAFGYQKLIRVGTTETLTLQMPDSPITIPFMCSMGMYRGVIRVI